VEQGKIDVVDEFCYLGEMMSWEAKSELGVRKNQDWECLEEMERIGKSARKSENPTGETLSDI